jgi:uncharacterized membrane protein
MPVATAILALAVVGAVVGASFVLGAPVFALPVVAALLAGWAVVALGRRAARQQPRGRQPIEFTEEDRATLLPSATPEERRRNRREAARR